jgi:hypothetical protein
MGLKFKLATSTVALTALAGVVIAPASSQVPGAPAQVVDFAPPTSTAKFRVTDFGRSASAKDDKHFKAPFRILKNTGNCCENYLTSSSGGRIFDQGGKYINYTDDRGKTWKSVQPLAPLVNGEGTIAMGPGGDVLGVQWDPYSGDHLQAYKYDARGEAWVYLESPLHTPFYDRPWLSVVPGPFIVNGSKVPYVNFVDGYPHTGTLLYSTDGLTYTQASSPYVDSNLEEPVQSWIPTKADAQLDIIQPNSNSPIVPLGGGRALAPPDAFGSDWSILNPKTLRWAPFQLPGGEQLRGRFLVDGRGRLHNLIVIGDSFEYRISTDEGKSWKSTVVTLPTGITANSGLQLDFRANAKVGVAAVSMHTRNGNTNSDQDLLYKIDISSDQPRPARLYEIGLGDIDASQSGPPADIRFDFNTVAILPDGRIAVSFLDSSTDEATHLAQAAVNRLGPALAIEL